MLEQTIHTNQPRAEAEKKAYDLLVKLIPPLARLLGSVKYLRRGLSDAAVQGFSSAMDAIDAQELDLLEQRLGEAGIPTLAVDALLAYRIRRSLRVSEHELEHIEQSIMDLFEFAAEKRLPP